MAFDNVKFCFKTFLQHCRDGNVDGIQRFKDVPLSYQYDDICSCGCHIPISFVTSMEHFPTVTFQYLIQENIISTDMILIPDCNILRVYKDDDNDIYGSVLIYVLSQMISRCSYWHKYHNEDMFLQHEPEHIYDNQDIISHDIERERFNTILYLIDYIADNAPHLLNATLGDPLYDDGYCLIECVISICSSDETVRSTIYTHLVNAGVNPFAKNNPKYMIGKCLRGHIDIGNDMISRISHADFLDILNGPVIKNDDSIDTRGYLISNLNYIIDTLYNHRYEASEWTLYWIHREFNECIWLIKLGIDLDKVDSDGMNAGDYINQLYMLSDEIFPIEDTDFHNIITEYNIVPLHDDDAIRTHWITTFPKLQNAMATNNSRLVDKLMTRGYNIMTTDEHHNTILDYIFNYTDVYSTSYWDTMIKFIDFSQHDVCHKMFTIIMNVAQNHTFYHYPHDHINEHLMIYYIENHKRNNKYQNTYDMLYTIINHLSHNMRAIYGKNSNNRHILLDVMRNNPRIQASTVEMFQDINGEDIQYYM